MQYSLSTLKKKANDAGYSFQEGYQRYNRKGWGYVPATDGDRVVGYQILTISQAFWYIPHTTIFTITLWSLKKRLRF